MNMMKHRGYTARVEYDNENRTFVGYLEGIKDTVNFQGSSVDELEAAFHEAVGESSACCEKTCSPAQKSCSGGYSLRPSPCCSACCCCCPCC